MTGNNWYHFSEPPFNVLAVLQERKQEGAAD